MLGFLFVLATATQVSEPAFSIHYHDGFSDWYSQILSEEHSFDDDTPVKPAVTVNSRLELSTARIVQTDTVQVPYDQSVAYIAIHSELGDPIFLITTRFRTVTLSWVGENLLVIRRDVGHVAGIEEIFDLEERRWLWQRSISYAKR